MDRALGGVKAAALAAGATFGAMELARWAGDAIQLAVAAEEVDSKFEAVFGSSQEFTEALSEWADMAGITDTASRDLAATFGNLAMAQGISGEDTQALTLLVAELAGDMASFNDADPEQVFEDLNKALLTTEREGMKKYGIALTQAEIDQGALEIATKDGRKEVTKADKALAAYELTVKQAGKAVGDLERTQDSAANQQRQLKAALSEMQETIGRELLPVYQELLQLTVSLTPLLKNVAGAAGLLTDSLGPLTAAMKVYNGDAVDVVSVTKDWLWASLKLNPITGALMFAVDGLVGSLKGAEEQLDKVENKTKDLTFEQLQAQAQYKEYAKGMAGIASATWDAAAASDEFNRELQTVASMSVAAAAAFEDYLMKVALAGGTTHLPTISTGGNIGFATGGRVPGPTGKPMLATVHGGESITAPGQQGGGGGGGVVINVTAIDPVSAATAVVDAIRYYESTQGPL